MVATKNIDELRDVIAAAGLHPPEHIEADGNLHRFSSNGDPRDDSGWYVAHDDHVPAGAFGCWRSGISQTWCSKTDAAMTQSEIDAHQQRIQAMQYQRKADAQQRQQQAQVWALKQWQQASPAHDHPYLALKGIQSYGLRMSGDLLLIPMRDTEAALHSLQTIDADGDKRFLQGGRVKGCYLAIGKPTGTIVICEGYATGASIHETTGHAVAVAFNAGNLLPVAMALRAKHPAIRIIVAADDDHLTKGNPGYSKGVIAAQAVGALLALPTFTLDRPDKATDFNDLHTLQGPDAVRQGINSAVAVNSPAPLTFGGRDAWPEPQPLIERINPEPYPLDALPDLVRLAVEEVQAFVKAPVALVAASALSALSLAVQGVVDIERAIKLSGPVGLYMLSIADSGERKTTTDNFFTKAIREYEAQAQDDAKPLVQEFSTKYDAWEAQRAGLKEKIKELAKKGQPRAEQIAALEALNKAEPVKPRVPRLVYSDVTPEELAFKLANRWPSGGVMSSEAGTVLGGPAMGKDSAMRNMALLNQLWDGVTVNVDRRSTDSFMVRGARLTMSLQVQEVTLRAFFDASKGLARGIGFLARFLVSWPTSTQGTRNFTEAPPSWPRLYAFNERLSTILRQTPMLDEQGALIPQMLVLAPDAKALWVAFHDAIEAELASGGDLHDVRDVASKTADNAARLAALIHVLVGCVGPVGVDAMESATRIVAWHLSEAKRFLTEIALPADQGNLARLDAWVQDYCRRHGVTEVPTREIQRNGPFGLRDKLALFKAIDGLTELGRVRLMADGKKKLVQVHPALLAETSK